jgi:3-methyladenine DNA glycosylase AlkD
MNAREFQIRLRSLSNPDDAAFLAKFFKTGLGEYGQGDVFIGVRVPAIRKVAKQFKLLPLSEVVHLLHSPIHEERLAALVILVLQTARGNSETRKRGYDMYLANITCINNWDLVDLSAPQIAGVYLEDKSRRPLYRLAKSKSLWERRISILATLHFIRQKDFADTLKIAEILFSDKEDLIHKAVGWMLREVGKRDQQAEEEFLERHYRIMPRTMLRYAIERFPERKRQSYLSVSATRKR